MTTRTPKPKVFRASFAVYRAYLDRWDGRGGARLVWIIPAVVALTIVETAFSGKDIWWPFVETGIFALAGLYLLLSFKVTRITASQGKLEVRNALGITRRFEGLGLSRVVRFSDYRIPMGPAMVGSMAMSFERLIVLDSRGRPALSWLGSNWSDRQMTQLETELGIPVDDISGSTNAAGLRRRYPHAVPWIIAHWFLGGLIISGAIIVLAGAAIAIDIAITGG